jgi:tetratricopeptide (TPR) repeat protein
MQHKNWASHRWEIAILAQVLIYIGLTIAVFVVNKKIECMETSDEAFMISTSPDELHHQKEAKLRQEIHLQPNDVKSLELLAKYYEQQGKFDQAIAEYKKILAMKPQDIEAHLGLGILYMSKEGCNDLAANHLQKVLEVDPSHTKKKNIEIWIKSLQSQGTSKGKKGKIRNVLQPIGKTKDAAEGKN